MHTGVDDSSAISLNRNRIPGSSAVRNDKIMLEKEKEQAGNAKWGKLGWAEKDHWRERRSLVASGVWKWGWG